MAADEAEIEDLTRDEEIELDIEKCAWRRSLSWHFSDGKKSFDARIEDQKFWKRIESGGSIRRRPIDYVFISKRLRTAQRKAG